MPTATSVEDLFLRLETCGVMLRIHTDHTPSMYHFATVSPAELEVLRQIHNVIRLGRVQSLHADRMVLARGSVAVAPDTLFVDCTASAVEARPAQAMFQGDTIVPQLVRSPLVAFSAAMTAYVEVHYDDDAHKNRLCASVPFPHSLAEYPRTMLANMMNTFQWGQDKALREWIRTSRLDAFGKLTASADKQDPAKQAILARMKELAAPAAANLQRLAALEPAGSRGITHET